MSISAIARGVLAGSLKNRETDAAEKERRRREQLEQIELVDRLSNTEGFSFDDEDGEDEDRDPTGSGELPAMPVEQISDGQGGTTSEGVEPAVSPAARERPKTAMEVARITIGGRERSVRFDPSQSPAARRARRDQLNRAAHAASEPGEEYDEGRDYVGDQRTQRRTEAELDNVTQAIIDSGIETDPKKARAWAIANPTLDRISKARAPKAPVRGTPGYNAALADEEDIRGRTRARYRDTDGAAADTPTSAQKRTARIRSARGNAAMWAEGGNDADAIAGALARFYPEISVGELRGIAIDVVRAKDRAARGAGGADDTDWLDDDAPATPAAPVRGGPRDRGEAPETIVDEALDRFGGDVDAAAEYLRSQGYR